MNNSITHSQQTKIQSSLYNFTRNNDKFATLIMSFNVHGITLEMQRSVKMESKLERTAVEALEMVKVGHRLFTRLRIQRIFAGVKLFPFLIIRQNLSVNTIVRKEENNSVYTTYFFCCCNVYEFFLCNLLHFLIILIVIWMPLLCHFPVGFYNLPFRSCPFNF